MTGCTKKGAEFSVFVSSHSLKTREDFIIQKLKSKHTHANASINQLEETQMVSAL